MHLQRHKNRPLGELSPANNESSNIYPRGSFSPLYSQRNIIGDNNLAPTYSTFDSKTLRYF